MEPLKFGNGWIISSHTLLHMWLPILLGLMLNHVSEMSPRDPFDILGHGLRLFIIKQTKLSFTILVHFCYSFYENRFAQHDTYAKTCCLSCLPMCKTIWGYLKHICFSCYVALQLGCQFHITYIFSSCVPKIGLYRMINENWMTNDEIIKYRQIHHQV